VFAVVTTLGMILIALLAVVWASRQVDAASSILGGADVDRWRSCADELAQGGEALRDAVELRERR